MRALAHGLGVVLGVGALLLLASKRRDNGRVSREARTLQARGPLARQIMATAEHGAIPADLAVATALVESGLEPSVRGDHGFSVGLFQINTKAHREWTIEELLEPAVNITAGLTLLGRFLDWSRVPGADPDPDYHRVRLRYTGALSPKVSDATRENILQRWDHALAATRQWLREQEGAV